MKFAFRIALRFLTSNKGQTVLIALGIAVGVSVQIFIGLLIQGLQKSLIDKTIGNSPQITIVSNSEDRAIGGWEEKLGKLGKLGDQIKYLSVASDSQAFVKNNSKTEAVLIRGFDIPKSDNIYKIKKNLISGKLPNLKNEAIIGKDLSVKLGIKPGNNIEIITPSGKSYKLYITGVFDLKVAALNSTWLITDLSAAQNISDSKDSVTSIEMQLKKVFNADLTAEEVRTLLNDKALSVKDWKTQNAELLSGLKGQSISSYMIQFFVLIAVVLGIASVLAISVIQKSKQIGILKAMGVKDGTASMIFMFQGFLLGLIGAFLGILLGLLLSIMFTRFAVNPDGTPVVALYLNYGFIAFSGLIALVSSTIASIIPAIRSKNLNPIEVIKNG